ncbi:MAG: hypothetical protein ACK4GR_03575, partial [bacterium]
YKGEEISVFSISKDDLLGKYNQIYQKTNNLNWQKIVQIPFFYWLNPFVISQDNIYLPYISNTFTILGKIGTDKISKGEYVSKVFDAGEKNYLHNIIVNSSGKFECFVRAGNNPIVDQTWTDFVEYNKISTLPKYRYFQYKLIIYPQTTIYSILGVVQKVNYKPFIIINLDKKFYNKNDSINAVLWDPNGDKLKVYLEYYNDNKWEKIIDKLVETKSTGINQPDFSTNVSLELYNLPLQGKVKLRANVDDSPSNPENYFIQQQIFEIFIDNTLPIINKYQIINKDEAVIIKVEVEDESFVEVFIKIGEQIFPMRLNQIQNKFFKYELKVKAQSLDDVYIVARDLAGNKSQQKIVIK